MAPDAPLAPGASSTAWRAVRRCATCQHPGVHSRHASGPIRSAGAVVAVLLLAGCAAQTGTEDAAATGSASSSSSATSGSAVTEEAAASSAAGADATPFPADTDADVAEPVDAAGLTVTTVRAARHEGYDRVVLELAGSGTPGWSVEYVDQPSSQGRGEAVDVPGAAHLQVTLQGVTAPYESGAVELARGPVGISGTDVVQGAFYDATYEGTSVAWLGTSGRVPFRVYALTGPSRVVVEVADAG